ncbi:hypothetical protein MHYP_G00062730 [Metynnis hypsauchen]
MVRCLWDMVKSCRFGKEQSAARDFESDSLQPVQPECPQRWGPDPKALVTLTPARSFYTESVLNTLGCTGAGRACVK